MEVVYIARRTKSVDAKRFNFEDAFTLAKENEDIEIISSVTEDRYKIEKVHGKDEIKFYSNTISRWRKCEFFSTKEVLADWYVISKGKLIK